MYKSERAPAAALNLQAEKSKIHVFPKNCENQLEEVLLEIQPFLIQNQCAPHSVFFNKECVRVFCHLVEIKKGGANE